MRRERGWAPAEMLSSSSACCLVPLVCVFVSSVHQRAVCSSCFEGRAALSGRGAAGPPCQHKWWRKQQHPAGGPSGRATQIRGVLVNAIWCSVWKRAFRIHWKRMACMTGMKHADYVKTFTSKTGCDLSHSLRGFRSAEAWMTASLTRANVPRFLKPPCPVAVQFKSISFMNAQQYSALCSGMIQHLLVTLTNSLPASHVAIAGQHLNQSFPTTPPDHTTIGWPGGSHLVFRDWTVPAG